MKYINIENRTTYKAVYNAWNRDEFSIVDYGGAYTIEGRGLSRSVRNLIMKEMKRLYPDYVCIE